MHTIARGLPISELTSRTAVLEAIAECDRRGRPRFLAEYGYARALKYRLRYKGRVYDSKAIAGVAWGLQHHGDGARRPPAFSGGAQSSVPTLRRLGFTIEADDGAAAESPPNLRPSREYSWEELAEAFDFAPNYLGIAGGMIPRPSLDSLLLITSSREGGSFDYGDEWDGGDLIYAGRGLTGHQELVGANRQVAENSRELFLFEYANSRRLFFHGKVRCVDHWESTGFDKKGQDRRVYRFRLRVESGRSRRQGRRRPNSGRKSRDRDASSFRPRAFDPGRKPAERRRSAPGDPESQRVLAEQADLNHQSTLSQFGLWLRDRGWTDLEEIDGAIDLLGVKPGRGQRKRVLFEVKSIRSTTERGRVRSGLAQLLEYRLFLGAKSDGLCLVSNRPIAERRLRLLDSLGIGHVYLQDGEFCISGTRASRKLFPNSAGRDRVVGDDR